MVRIGNLRTTHFSRNPKIAQVLHEYEYVREFGEGIDRIYREMAEVGQTAPEFKQFDFMLHATIRKVVPQDDTQGDTQDGKITGNQINKGGTQELSDIIYDKIKDNPNITMDEFAVSLNVGRRTIARYLKQMSDRVHYVGSGYSGHWEVIPPEKKD